MTVDELRDLIDRYYEREAVGGQLHIVLDDYSYDDESIRWCVERATDPEAVAIGEAMLSMSLADRAAANDPRTCRTCGHAASLHHWWFPDGNWGHSSTGPCDLPDCDCQDAAI